MASLNADKCEILRRVLCHHTQEDFSSTDRFDIMLKIVELQDLNLTEGKTEIDLWKWTLQKIHDEEFKTTSFLPIGDFPYGF